MYHREIEERAALLLRLGYAAAAVVKSRLAGNVDWDFELHARPSHAADVDTHRRRRLRAQPGTLVTPLTRSRKETPE